MKKYYILFYKKLRMFKFFIVVLCFKLKVKYGYFFYNKNFILIKNKSPPFVFIHRIIGGKKWIITQIDEKVKIIHMF